MKLERKIKIYHGLLPLACLYRLGVSIRNWMFDRGILHSQSFPLPVICVGNISVGGTGKTPHTEYLIRLLQNEFQVAVLSRDINVNRKVSFWLLPKQMPTRLAMSLIRWHTSFRISMWL